MYGPAMSKEAYSEYAGFSIGRIEGWIRRNWEAGVHFRIQGHTNHRMFLAEPVRACHFRPFKINDLGESILTGVDWK